MRGENILRRLLGPFRSALAFGSPPNGGHGLRSTAPTSMSTPGGLPWVQHRAKLWLRTWGSAPKIWSYFSSVTVEGWGEAQPQSLHLPFKQQRTEPCLNKMLVCRQRSA